MSPYVLGLAIADRGGTETLRRALENQSNSLFSNVALRKVAVFLTTAYVPVTYRKSFQTFKYG